MPYTSGSRILYNYNNLLYIVMTTVEIPWSTQKYFFLAQFQIFIKTRMCHVVKCDALP